MPAPARSIFAVPLTVNGRTVTARIEATSQAEAEEVARNQTQRFVETMAPDAQGDVWDFQSATGWRGRVVAGDEQSARAALAGGFAQRDAVTAFEREVAAFGQPIADQEDEQEAARILAEIDADRANDPQPSTFAQGAMATARVAGDVAVGLAVEGPTQVIDGAISGINEMADSADELAQTISDSIFGPDMAALGVSPEAMQAVRGMGIGTPSANLRLNPNTEGAETVTGGFVRGLSQFGVGLAAAGAALRGYSVTTRAGQFGKSMLAGAIADFTAFDQADARLSDLIQQVPELRNPVTEWLAGDEDDAALEGRLKNMVEGGLLGLGAEAIPPLVRSLSAYRALKRGQPAIEADAAQRMAEATAREERTAAEVRAAQASLGDESPNAPMVEVVRSPNVETVVVEGRRPAQAADEAVPAPDAAARTAEAPTAEAPAPQAAPAAEAFAAPAPTPRPVAEAPQGRVPLNEVAPRMWRETSPELAEEFFPTSTTRGRLDPRTDVFLSDNPDLALGQGDNRGVMLEFDLTDSPLEGHLSRAKPTWSMMWEDGAGSEFVASYNQPGAYRSALRAARFRMSDIGPQQRVRWNNMLRRLEAQGWTRTEADGVVTVVRPDRAAPSPEPARPDAPEAATAPAMPTAARPASVANMAGDALEADALTRTADAVGGTPQRPQDPAQVAREGLGAPDFGANPFRINFARINTPDDIKSVLAQMVEAAPDAIDAARRGTQSWDATTAGAGAILNDDQAFATLMSRRVGQAVNDQEATALRMLWQQSGTKLRELAQRAADTRSDADLLAFRQMQAAHGAITEQVMGARAEAGRALQAWRIAPGSNEAVSRRLFELIGQARDGSLEAAEAIARMDPLEAAELARKGALVTDGQRMRTLVQAMMMSSPATHVANVLGNGMAILFEAAVRGAAPAIRGGAPGEIAAGEGAAMLAGATRAFWEIVGASQKAVDFVASRQGAMTKAESEAMHFFPNAASSERVWVRAIANVGNAIAQVPGQLTGLMDHLFAYAGTSASLNASAFRQAQREIEEGLITIDQAPARMEQLRADPTPAMLDEAARFAEEATFTRSQEHWERASGKITPGMGRDLLNLRSKMDDQQGAAGIVGGYLAGAILPFVNTPANIFSYSFRSTPLAPLMRRYRDDIAAGGARGEVAKARMVVGSIVLWTAFSLATAGTVTGGGPMDPEQRQLLMRQGWQPYSIKIGGRWYSYNRLDPLGSLLSFAGDLADMSFNTDWGDIDQVDQWTEVASVGIVGIANMVTNKTMLTGLADTFEAMGDPRRFAENWLLQRLTAVVPAALGAAERVQDPWARDGMSLPKPEGRVADVLKEFVGEDPAEPSPGFFGSIIQGLDSTMQLAKTRIPGLSETQPLRFDYWGRPVMAASGLGPWWEVMAPSRSSQERGEPIDDELQRLRYYPQMPRREITLPEDMRANDADNGRYSLTDRPDIYNRFLEIRGELILPRLNAMVSGEGPEAALYQSLTPAEQVEEIKDVIKDAGKEARAQVIDEFYMDFADMAARRRDAYERRLPYDAE